MIMEYGKNIKNEKKIFDVISTKYYFVKKNFFFTFYIFYILHIYVRAYILSFKI